MSPSSFLRPIGKAWMALWWLAYPVVPLLLEDTYYQLCTFELGANHQYGPDPYDWGVWQWAMILSPLCGFAILAGCTWKIGDEAGRSGWWRSWRSRRSVWVGIGPWLGLVSLAAVWFVVAAGGWVLERMGIRLPQESDVFQRMEALGKVVMAVVTVAVLTWLAAGWLIVAWAALRRARRMGRFRGALGTGVGLAIVFVGSLFGGYWLVTTMWKDYYFDPAIVP